MISLCFPTAVFNDLIVMLHRRHPVHQMSLNILNHKNNAPLLYLKYTSFLLFYLRFVGPRYDIRNLHNK